MPENLGEFLERIPDWSSKSPGELIPYFVYYLTVVLGADTAAPRDVENCFTSARLHPYSNIPAYMSSRAKREKGRRPLFVKTPAGYSLERACEVELTGSLSSIPAPGRAEAKDSLSALVGVVKKSEDKAFLKEALDCYRIGAFRAAIVLVWILTLHHLYEFILQHKLTDFNAKLVEVTDKRVKAKQVSCVDDFSDIPESIFIQVCREARIISNDVRKILETKLGIRNSAAHPSAIVISEVKAAEFILDLVHNVIEKYPV